MSDEIAKVRALLAETYYESCDFADRATKLEAITPALLDVLEAAGLVVAPGDIADDFDMCDAEERLADAVDRALAALREGT